MTTNERLKQLRQVLGLKQNEFGKKIGLTTSSISNIENGIRNVTDKHILILQIAFNVNKEWLLTGDGEIFVQESTLLLDEIVQKYNLTKVEIDIIRKYVELPPSTRHELLSFFSSLYNRPKEMDDIDVEIEDEIAEYRKELEEIKRTEALLASQKSKVDQKRTVHKDNLINFKHKD